MHAVKTDELEELYQEVILDHYRNPRHCGHMETCDVCQPGVNPLCGDELELCLRLAGGRRVEAVFDGRGCSISRASASILMDTVNGKSVEDCRTLLREFEELIAGVREASANLEDMTDVEALSRVRKFPVRIKCASLAWKAFGLALVRLPLE